MENGSQAAESGGKLQDVVKPHERQEDFDPERKISHIKGFHLQSL